MNFRQDFSEEEFDKGKTRVVLKPRDKEALSLIYEQQFLTFDQYKNKFFPGAWPQQARARLLKLERAGFLRRPLSPSLGQAKIIKLTPMGTDMARGLSHVHVPYNHRIEHGTALHDKTVTDVRLRLAEWIPDSTWLPERHLKAQNLAHVPDGVLQYEGDDGREYTCAIEVELSPKSVRSYYDVLEFYDGSHFTWTLYVVPNAVVADRIAKIFREHFQFESRRIGLVLLDDLLSGTPAFRFPDGPKQMFAKAQETRTL